MKVAIIGAGAMAQEHARAFADVPGTVIAGICSRTRAKAEKLAAGFGGCVVYDSPFELAAKSHAQLVVVAVSAANMYAVGKQAFSSPWTVLLEKPPGLDLAEARDLEKTAAASKRKVYVALNRRHYASTRFVLDDLKPRGGNRHIRVLDQQSLEKARAGGHPPRVVEHWMYANSIHLIDYFRIFGRGTVTGVENEHRWDPKQPGVVSAKLTFSSGDTGSYEAVWAGPGPWAVSVVGAQRSWEIRPLESVAYQDATDAGPIPVAGDKWDKQFKPGFRRQAEEAVAAARGRHTALPTLSEAVATMDLISRIYAEAK
jgi:predicted dehydrogenase